MPPGMEFRAGALSESRSISKKAAKTLSVFGIERVISAMPARRKAWPLAKARPIGR